MSRTIRRGVVAAVIVAAVIVAIVHFTQPSGYQRCVNWLISDMKSGGQATSAPGYCTSLTRAQQKQAGNQALQTYERQVRAHYGIGN